MRQPTTPSLLLFAASAIAFLSGSTAEAQVVVPKPSVSGRAPGRAPARGVQVAVPRTSVSAFKGAARAALKADPDEPDVYLAVVGDQLHYNFSGLVVRLQDLDR